MCPHCKETQAKTIKKGFFSRRSGGRWQRVQRFTCKNCRRSFSRRTDSVFRGERKEKVNRALFLLLCAGVSQRECARVLNINQKTVARKVIRLGRWARLVHQKHLCSVVGESEVVFDEMETFEHTKCKPLSIAVAVDRKSRRIFAAQAASMPAKGKLAAISRKKYGYRPDHRPRALNAMFSIVKATKVSVTGLRSDECPRYPSFVKRHFPALKHETFKGRRGCIVGQGELKRGGFDPLFSLNHTCAMVRDHLKRLSRRTWCTTKRPDRLQDLLDIYIVHHNRRLMQKKKSRGCIRHGSPR